MSTRNTRPAAASALAWLLCIVAMLGHPVGAAEPVVRAAAAKLLEVGWSVTPQARAAADAQYDELRRLAGDDRDGQLAWLLVLIQQRRYDEALKRADAILAKDAGDLTALRARVWIATLLKNYEGAMLAAEALGEQMAANPAATEDEQAIHDELFAFSGRIYGFLGGPVAESVNQDQRKASEKEVLGRIVETRRALFEEARDGVVGKFLAMTGAKDDERAKAAAEAEAAKDKTLKELEEERQATADRTKELQDRQSKLQSELRDELAAIAKEDRPLVQELARLQARAGSISRDLLAYDAEISRLRSQADREKDPVLRQQLRRESDRLAIVATGIQSDLLAVNRLADGVQGQRAGLAARQQKAQSASGEQLQRIDQELGGLAKRDRRNDAIQRRATRPVSATTSKSRSLAAQAAALTTYDQFPLESAKARLLDALAK